MFIETQMPQFEVYSDASYTLTTIAEPPCVCVCVCVCFCWDQHTLCVEKKARCLISRSGCKSEAGDMCHTGSVVTLHTHTHISHITHPVCSWPYYLVHTKIFKISTDFSLSVTDPTHEDRKYCTGLTVTIVGPDHFPSRLSGEIDS